MEDNIGSSTALQLFGQNFFELLFVLLNILHFRHTANTSQQPNAHHSIPISKALTIQHLEKSCDGIHHLKRFSFTQWSPMFSHLFQGTLIHAEVRLGLGTRSPIAAVKWLSGWSWVGSSRCSCLTLGTKPSSWSNVQIKLPFHDTITHVLHVHVLRFYFVAAWDAHPFLISSNSMICSSISSSFSLVSASKWTKSYIIPQMSRMKGSESKKNGAPIGCEWKKHVKVGTKPNSPWKCWSVSYWTLLDPRVFLILKHRV